MARKITQVTNPNDLIPLYSKPTDVQPSGFIAASVLSEEIDVDTASEIVNVPAGNIVATDVQAAINELDGQDTTLQSNINTLTSSKVAKAGDTMTGGLVTAPGTATDASINIPVGVAPSAPTEGDVWNDGSSIKIRSNSRTLSLGNSASFKSYNLGDVGVAGKHYLAGYYVAPTAHKVAVVGGSATQTLGTAGQIRGAHAFAVAAGNGSFAYDVTVTGTHGLLNIDIDGTSYSEAFDTSAAVTATNWIATHTAALGALGTPIVPSTGGAGIITMVSADDFVITDIGTTMSISVGAYIHVTCAGTNGNLVLTIDGVDYSEAFSSDIATTVGNWVSTHGVALGLLTPAITPNDEGGGVLKLTTTGTPVIVDASTGDITATETNLVDIVVIGTNGNLVINVDGVDYSEAYDTNLETTAANWDTSHTAALAGLGVTVSNALGVITLEKATAPVIVDNSAVDHIAFTSAVAANLCVLTVTGVSITDAGVKNDSDSEVLVADCSAASTNQYFETSKKWLGQVTYTLTGETGASFTFNYGYCKYEDFGNRDFTLTDIEFLAHAGANETSLDVQVKIHDANSYTYSAAAFDPMAGADYKMSTDYGTNNDLALNFDGAYKRSGLTDVVLGSQSQGIIVQITHTVNNGISHATLHLGVAF